MPPHAIFGDNQNLFAHPRVLAQHFPEDFFGLAIAINVRMVKQRVTAFVGRDDRSFACGPDFRF